MYERLTVNLAPAKARREKLEGRDHTVVPAVILAKGVWTGNRWPIYYGEEFFKKAKIWNHLPAVVYHPMKGDQHISAADPAVLNARKVGFVLNSKDAGGKWRAEVWIDEARANAVDKRILQKIGKGEKVEVSTGMELTLEVLKKEETYEGKKYKHVARDFTPDHLAILPDCQGAFSIKDGGGLLVANQEPLPESTAQAMRRGVIEALKPLGIELGEDGLVVNELTFTGLSARLNDLLAAKYGEPGKYWRGHVCDVYPESKRCVFYNDGVLLMIDYATDGDAVSLSGDAVPVERVTEYRASDGGIYAANAAGELNLVEREDGAMAFDKKAHLDGLVGKLFKPEDRAKFEALPDDTVAALCVPVANAAPPPNPNPPAPANPPAPQPQPAPNPPAPPPNPQPPKLTDLIANADPKTQRMFKRFEQSFEQEKAGYIETIVANGSNKFTKEWLGEQDIDLLAGMAEIAKTGNAGQGPDGGSPPMFGPQFNGNVPNYGGAGGFVAPVYNQQGPDGGLDVPEQTYENIFARK